MSGRGEARSADLRAVLEGGGVHVLDGAMGTLLYGRGLFLNVCYDELNLSRPELIEQIHREYVTAGARILETNTFGANPVKLSSFGLEAKTEEINHAAAERGRAAIRTAGVPGVLLLGAFGPLGIRIEPWGPTSEAEAEAYFGRQVDGLLEGGVDGFLLETFQDVGELEQALRAIRRRSELPVIAQVTVEESGRTAYGADVEGVAAALEDLGADAVGLNCSVGPAGMLDAVERMVEATRLPVSAQPNAGVPRSVGDRMMYLASPEYLARYAVRMVDAGVRLVGGCCGTTPEHVRAVSGAVAARTSAGPPGAAPRPAGSRLDGGSKPVAGPSPDGARRDGAARAEGGRADGARSPGGRRRALPDAPPLAGRSRLGRRLSEREFVVSIELLPPRGWDPTALLEAARRAAEVGVDLAGIPDSPGGHPRMASLPAAELVRRETGLDVLPHYACRDRHMPGMISDLVGAAAIGLRNVLVVTGDPTRAIPRRELGTAPDIDSIGLTNVLERMNRGMDPGGHPVEPPTEFVIGVGLDQGAADLTREHRRFHWKVEAGADFAMTQPVFDVEALRRFVERAGSTVPIVAGVWPLDSLRSAEFLANEIAGVHLPADTIERMKDAEARGSDAAREEGVEIAVEAAEAIRPLVAGIQINTARTGVELALEVVRRMRARSAEPVEVG